MALFFCRRASSLADWHTNDKGCSVRQIIPNVDFTVMLLNNELGDC